LCSSSITAAFESRFWSEGKMVPRARVDKRVLLTYP